MKNYIKPELNITSYEAKDIISLSSVKTQTNFETKKYSEIKFTGVNF